MMLIDPNEVRTEFNRRYGQRFATTNWVRLDLKGGPVLAKRNVPHPSSQIYVLVLNGGMAFHRLVTQKRELKSNGTTSVTPPMTDAWVTLIGYTEQEYQCAKRSTEKTDFTHSRIALYEGITGDNRSGDKP